MLDQSTEPSSLESVGAQPQFVFNVQWYDELFGYNHSPFENFELVLFFPSCVLGFIFRFTSFNLLIFQIIFILFNLHEFLISTLKPNSLILRSNALLMNF